METVLLFGSIAIIVIISIQVAKGIADEKRIKMSAERQRIRNCGKVVLSFANHMGYIARSCIKKEEIETLIDNGISPENLRTEITDRIDKTHGIILGYQNFDGLQINVKLPIESRERHVYVVGKSGSGKTNLLRNMIFQDLELGNGIGIIAPEKEMLFEEVLPYIPDDRLQDVLLFDPSDPHCPPFNPLFLDNDEDMDIKVDEVLTIFKRTLGSGAGPRMEEILRQALYTLIGRPNATLLDIERLLDRTDQTFRDEIIRTSTDHQSIHYWRNVYPSLPKDAHLPITNRLGRLLRPQIVRNILCNTSRKSLNFRAAMDSGNVMLFNLSDGILGEQNSQLLGQLIVSKFQLAVMSRASIAKDQRRNFFLYIDEFQTFTGTSATSYEKILSRARKYKLGLILAHQQTGQIPTDLLKEILGNTSTCICFLVSREDALRFSKELVTQQNGEIINIPEEKILRLRVGQAWCKIGQHSLHLKTYLADQHPNHNRTQYVIDRIQQNARLLNRSHGDQQSNSMNSNRSGERLDSGPQPVKTEHSRTPPVADILNDLDPSTIFD